MVNIRKLGGQFNAPENYSQASVPLLQVDGVTFGYGRQPLLYDVHLQVMAGEMVGLLGTNGSGKTTLLRLLRGVFRPQQGKGPLAGCELQHWAGRVAAQSNA